MTTYDKNTLKTYFQTGDVPTGTDYGNLIDSQVNVAETSSQQMIGALITTELIAPRVSCTNLNVTGILSAASFNLGTLSNLTVGNLLVNTSANINRLVVAGSAIFAQSGGQGGINVSGSCKLRPGANIFETSNSFTGAMQVNSTITFQTSPSRVIYVFTSTMASGGSQGTAAQLDGSPMIWVTAASATNSGVRLAANLTGTMQYIFNPDISANIFPPTGGHINNLSNNAAFGMAVGITYRVLHVGASAYSVV